MKNDTTPLDDFCAASSLISAESLLDILWNKDVKVFDVRGTWASPARALPDDYNAGHIPGAVFLDWTRHFIEQDVPLNLAALADKEAAATSFQALGINKRDHVVLYDDYSHMFAGRIWWAMRALGFNNVSVLNGGLKYWSSIGLPILTEPIHPAKGSFKPKENSALLVKLDDFLERKNTICVVDGRGAKGFSGKEEDPRAGHIPGSLNIPFSTVLNSETGRFLLPDQLSSVLEEAAPEWRDKPIIASCGAGYAATVILLALSQLGQDAPLFDGSFSTWKQDPKRPVSQRHTTFEDYHV